MANISPPTKSVPEYVEYQLVAAVGKMDMPGGDADARLGITPTCVRVPCATEEPMVKA